MRLYRSSITCDISACHKNIPGFYHGKSEAITNEEAIEIMASSNSTGLCSTCQVRKVARNVSFLISTEKLSQADASIDAMGCLEAEQNEGEKVQGPNGEASNL